MPITPSPGPAWQFTLHGEVIGDGGSIAAIDGRGEVEIGFAVDASMRGRGFATEAVGAICSWLLDQPEVRCVHASPDTTGSRRVLAKVGFASVVGGRYAMLAG